VSYFQASGIDRPLTIWKDAAGSIIPHENWRGEFASGTWGVGTKQGMSVDCPYGGAPNCLPISWPGWSTSAFGQRAVSACGDGAGAS
jgi:hypothetical protein